MNGGPTNPSATEQRGGEASAPSLTLGELTRAAGVSVRTVRYYIAEGLLPPPVGAGRRSAYAPGHLDRLRLIARWKRAYLPLKEIRRRLAGLDDAAVRRLLAADQPRPASAGPADPPPPDSAGDYLARLLGPRPDPPAPGAGRPDPAPLPGEEMPPMSTAAHSALEPPTALLPDPDPSRPSSDPFGPRPPLPMGAAVSFSAAPAEQLPPPPPEDGAPVEADAWRRIRLGDDVELLVRETAYSRRRELVDWLVAWARRVFG